MVAVAEEPVTWNPKVTQESNPDLDWTPLETHTFDDLDRSIVTEDIGAWFETYARIIDKEQKLVPPRANKLQERVCYVVWWCLDNGVPIRLLLLKPRQKGCSTISMAVLYWLMNRFDNFRGCVIGKEYSQADNLWKMLRTYSNNDKFDWGFKRQILDKVARMENGSTLEKETAEDSEAGRSGTFHGIIATEAARWREKGVANAEEVLNGLLNCVPYLPNTFVVQESTARGASGPFYESWCDALDFEDFKMRYERGENLNGYYIRIFAGWHEFPDSYDELTPEQAIQTASTMTPEETEMMQRLGLDYGHIEWRRRTIRTECQRDEQKFDREFPETPEHAFRASAPSRFNTRGLSVMKQEAINSDTNDAKWGILESQARNGKLNNRNFAFVPIEKYSKSARCIIIEAPRVGHKYLVALDNMTGEPADDEGKDLDHHAALVIRKGYFDPERGWQKNKVVARTPLAPDRPHNVDCRWDTDIIEETVWRLSQYYGDCLIVPERNMDRGLIRGLVKRGANVYETMTDEEHGEAKTPKRSGKYGFQTTGGSSENTRAWIIENAAREIREWDQNGLGIEVDLRTAVELENFIVNADGKAEAIAGQHDDSVLALCIGLALIEHATRMNAPAGRAELPRDLKKISKSRRVRGQYS